MKKSDKYPANMTATERAKLDKIKVLQSKEPEVLAGIKMKNGSMVYPKTEARRAAILKSLKEFKK